MSPADVKEYFKTAYNFNKITSMSNNSLHNWIKWGFVPFLSQKKLERLTEGQLVAEWDDREMRA